MPGKRLLTDGTKQSSKRGKKAKTKQTNKKKEGMDIELKAEKPAEETSVSKVLDLDVDGATEYLCPIEKEGDTVLDVECGPNKAQMYLSKLHQGSKGSCLLFQGSWLTPNEFQYVSGRETAKDWKRSIRHQGKSIKLLFSRGILSVGGGSSNKKAKRPKKCVKRSTCPRRGRRNVNVSLDSAGEENGESRETEVQCPEEQSVTGDSEENKSNSEDSKEQLNGEGDLSDANSDSTENYDVDFMDSATEQDKVCSDNEDIPKSTCVTDDTASITSEHVENDTVVLTNDDSVHDESCVTTDEKSEEISQHDDIEADICASIENETKIDSIRGEIDSFRGETPECEDDVLDTQTAREEDSKEPEEVEDDVPDQHPEEEQTQIDGEEAAEAKVEDEVKASVADEDKAKLSPEAEDDQSKDDDEKHVTETVENGKPGEDNIAMEKKGQEEEDELKGEEEQKIFIKRTSPGRESKLGSIIDQLRVNREKVTKERKNNAADGNHVRHDILADLTRDRPAPGFTNDNREDAIASITERRDDVSDLTKKRADGVADLSKERRYISTDAKVPKSIWQIPSQVSNSPLAKEIQIAKIIDEQRKDSRRHMSCIDEKNEKVHKSRHSISGSHHQKKHPERSTSAPSEIIDFLYKKRVGSPTSDRHTFSSPGLLYPWMKKESTDGQDKMDKTKSTSPSPRLTPVDKLKKSSSSPRDKKESSSSSEKDYNDYMRLLAAKQERNPFFLSPPLHDPYFSMWTPDLLFPPGMFNPYSMFMGSNGHRPEVPTTTSMSSFCSVPSTGGLPFVTPHRPPHSMPYPILDSYVPHPSPKESPSLPYSCKTNSRKRGPAEADTACALDLTTKRTKLECSKNDYFTSPASRTESADNCKKSALLNLSKAKTPDGDKSNTSKTHSNAHRHKKSIHSIWQEKDSKGQILQCKCGADNPENIMNWSAEKVFDFVSKLEGCSSYAKTFLNHRIEGKLLPLLTTDALIRNLGMKVGPAIILSEAVTRHVQDMSRFFHPCSYCKLKTSQRLSV